MLNAREPKIANRSDIFKKWVGESEANIRYLFEDAEAEQKRTSSADQVITIGLSKKLSGSSRNTNTDSRIGLDYR